MPPPAIASSVCATMRSAAGSPVRPGKPGRAPEAAVLRVERPPELGEGAPEDVGAWHPLARRGDHLLPDAAREVGRRGGCPVGVLGVDLVHPPEEREEAEAHPAVA